MLPRLTVEGRLVADPELRYSPSGTPIANMRIVASDQRKNEQTGKWEDTRTLWLDATAFNKLAENLVESVQKGDLVIVTGKLQTEEWTDKNSGMQRSKTSMIVDKVGADLTFRVLPHAGATHAQRAPAPAQQAYAGGDASPWGSDAPPF